MNLGSNNPRPGRTTSWLISFGDLLTLLVCFFLSIISFSTINKRANSPKAPDVSQNNALSQSLEDDSQQLPPPGTHFADIKVGHQKLEVVAEPLRIDFEKEEFEGAARSLSMKARKRLKKLIPSASYGGGRVIVSSCSTAESESPTQANWEIARLQALELKRQLIDAGWNGSPEEVRLQILGSHCEAMGRGEEASQQKIARIRLTMGRAANG